MESNNQEITAIVSKAIRGDLASYKVLYSRFAKPMYNVSIRLLNSKEDAEDVLQESFITAFKNLPAKGSHDIWWMATKNSC